MTSIAAKVYAASAAVFFFVTVPSAAVSLIAGMHSLDILVMVSLGVSLILFFAVAAQEKC